MYKNVKTTGFKVIVKINKAVMWERRNKIGELYIPSSMMAYSRNLQFGEVVSIGPDVYQVNKKITIGSTAIFHHIVEGSSEFSTVKGDRFLYDDSEYEYRYLIASNYHPENELFAVFNDNMLFLSNGIIFCDPHRVSTSGLHKISDNLYDIDDDLKIRFQNEELHLLNEARKEITNTMSKIPRSEEMKWWFDDMDSELKSINSQISEIQRNRNSIKLSELYVLYSGAELYKKGDVILVEEKKLYPLEFDNHLFALVRSDLFVFGKLVDGEYIPGPEYCIIKPNDILKEYSNGIVAPDNLNYKPSFGKIVSHGVGSDDFPLQVKIGNNVNFNSRKSVKIFINGKQHYLCHFFELMYIGNENELIIPVSGMIEINYKRPDKKIIRIHEKPKSETFVSGIIIKIPKHEGFQYQEYDRVIFDLSFSIAWKKGANSLLVHKSKIIEDITISES